MSVDAGKHLHRCGRTKRRRNSRRNSKDEFKLSATLFEPHIKFCSWMKKYGFSVKKCNMIATVFKDTGRGLMTNVARKPGEIIISIPGRLLINIDVVLQSEVGFYIKRFVPKMTIQQALSIFLIWERNKGRNSVWFPYIDVLPKSFSTPAYLSDDLLAFLPKNIFKKVQKHMVKFKSSFNDIQDYCENSWIDMASIFNYESFRWAWYCVNSRGIYLKGQRSDFIEDDGNYIALAPYLDLFNHSVKAQVQAGYNSVYDCYEIKTFDTYKKYDQVFISYGPHDNHHLFIEYGFILPNNPHDVYEFEFDEIMKHLSNYKPDFMEKKLNILRSNDLLQSKLCCTMEGLSWNLLVILRILLMDWKELSEWKKVLHGETISERNEQYVKQTAVKLIQNALDKTNELLLQFREKYSKDLTYPQQMVHQLILTDKQILQASLRLST